MQTELEFTKKQIQQKYPEIEVITIAKDLGKTNEITPMRELYDKVKHLDISILLNNVGFCQEGTFHKIKEQLHITTINVNIYSHCLLTKLMMPNLLARKKKSAMIVMSSFSGTHMTPGFANYSASKAFVRSWGH